MNFEHLDMLNGRLHRAKLRFEYAKGASDRKWHAAQVAQAEREIVGERKFLGLSDDACTLSDDELLRELGA